MYNLILFTLTQTLHLLIQTLHMQMADTEKGRERAEATHLQ